MKDTKLKESVQEAYRLFFEATLAGGVENILKTANQIFKSPVLFTNENYRLICQVPAKPIGEPIWDNLFEKKTLSPEIIWHFQDVFLNNQLNNYKPIYADWGPVEAFPRIFGEVVADNKILGHVAVFLGDRPLEDGDLEITEIFISALNIEIGRKRNGQDSYLPSSSIYLMDLLDRDTPFEGRGLAIQKLKKKIAGDFAVMVTPIGIKASQKAFASYAVAELTLRYRNIVSVIYEASIVTLLGEVDTLNFNPSQSSFFKQIVSFLAEYKMISGISDCFNNLADTFVGYRQAALTAKIAIEKGNTNLGIYNDYAPNQMFSALANMEKPEVFIHPVIDRLRSYDRAHHTEYFQTLKIFSMSMYNKESAASKLSIHRNTLLYRLNRIQDVFNISYEDEKTALHLLSSFLLLDAI